MSNNMPDTNQSPITRRETVAVLLASDGLSAKRIAFEMGLTENTVVHYLANARIKLGANNITALVAKAIRQGIIQ